jgi:hypothetical protein
MTLIVLPESTTSLRGLFNQVLPGVIQALEASGYTVNQENVIEAATESGWLQKLGIEPGSATLTVAANTSTDSIVAALRGKRFGQKGLKYADHDEALWDRIEALREKLSAANGPLVSTVADPDFVTGAPGAPGTFLPERGRDAEHDDDD